ncbi:10898_t:CDS:2, partial [Acaulospora morrowiae]
ESEVNSNKEIVFVPTRLEELNEARFIQVKYHGLSELVVID